MRAEVALLMFAVGCSSSASSETKSIDVPLDGGSGAAGSAGVAGMPNGGSGSSMGGSAGSQAQAGGGSSSGSAIGGSGGVSMGGMPAAGGMTGGAGNSPGGDSGASSGGAGSGAGGSPEPQQCDCYEQWGVNGAYCAPADPAPGFTCAPCPPGWVDCDGDTVEGEVRGCEVQQTYCP